MGQSDPSAVLAAVARLVAEAVNLRDVVARLAPTLKDAIPFERLHVLRLDRAEYFVLYVAKPTGEMETIGQRIGNSGVLPSPVDGDSKSRLVCTVRAGTRVHGAAWLTSTGESVFTDDHQ